MFRIAICDDNNLFLDYARECINSYIQSRNIQFLVTTFSQGEELLHSIETGDTYNLLLLDVEMPGIDGMSLAHCIREKSPTMPIAFVSAYINYSLDGYKVNAIRYILKDMDNLSDYIEECIDLVMSQIDKDMLCMEFDFSIGKRLLHLNDILYLESNKNYVDFVLASPCHESLRIRKPLRVLTEELKDYGFLSLNSKCTVNMSHIKRMYRYKAYLSGEIGINISQKKYNEVYRIFLLNEGSN